jgi:hypothetical protein
VGQCVTVNTGLKHVLTYQSKLCHVKSRVKTNYEAVYYQQTYLMNMLSDIKTEISPERDIYNIHPCLWIYRVTGGSCIRMKSQPAYGTNVELNE